MRIHHLNCACMCPPGGPLMDGFSKGVRGRLICHCQLIETDQGLVLIDTGFGVRDVEKPYSRLSPFFIQFNQIQFERKYTALDQVQALGFTAHDVRHIVLTHLDFDHAGGLEDFPEATVHVMQAEADAARARKGFIASQRYRPGQWDDVKRWKYYAAGTGEPWFGFEAVRDLDGLPPEILLIPLPGHTEGHAGVAVQTPDGWLLNAADTYFYRGEIGKPERDCTPGKRFYQTMMETDRPTRLKNQERVRALSVDKAARDAGVRIFCSHDVKEFETFAGRPAL